MNDSGHLIYCTFENDNSQHYNPSTTSTRLKYQDSIRQLSFNSYQSSRRNSETFKSSRSLTNTEINTSFKVNNSSLLSVGSFKKQLSKPSQSVIKNYLGPDWIPGKSLVQSFEKISNKRPLLQLSKISKSEIDLKSKRESGKMSVSEMNLKVKKGIEKINNSEKNLDVGRRSSRGILIKEIV